MQTRRKFIQNSGIFTAGLMMDHGSFFSAERKKIGLQMYTLRNVVNQNNIEGILNRVAAIGYKELEVFGFSTANKFWGLDPVAFKKLLKSTGLKAPAAHIAFENFLTGKDEDELRLISDAAATIGNKYIVVAWLEEKHRSNADNYKLIAEKLNKAGRIAHQYGLQLAYHNHDFEFTQLGNNVTGYDIILKNTDKELLKLELDLYWVVKAGKDPVQLFRENSGRFPLWHVKDLDKATNTFTEVGAGSIDFKKIFEQSKLAGLQHFFVEQDEVKKEVFKSIGESYAYVKGNLV
jgi:sugar phosphate isomerase/epimerase